MGSAFVGFLSDMSSRQINHLYQSPWACLSVLRVMRAYTGRDKIIKFEGCYHGHADSFLVKAGSGAATLGVPSSPGVPAKTSASTLSLSLTSRSGERTSSSARRGSLTLALITTSSC